MTSSTWTCDLDGPLIGVGIDAESAVRFARSVLDGPPSPLVFSEREVAHCLGLVDPARGLCAAFCAKEAFFKATRGPMDPRGCRLAWDPALAVQELELDPVLADETGARRALARVSYNGDECVVEVLVIGRDA
jgi:phosphopantetheinyl transferase (holo-ACP synthase)